MKVADEVILVPKMDGSVDEFFEAFFRAFTGNPSQIAHADDPFYSLSALPANGKAALKQFLSDPNPGKMWDTFEESTMYNNFARGILGELAIYKRLYKGLGYFHHPNAPGFDFTGPKWVQIKTVKDPTTAYTRMRDAVIDLVAKSPTDKPLRLHILKKLGSNSESLSNSLRNYIDSIPERDRIDLIIAEFELTP